jgi:hypothetical protein
MPANDNLPSNTFGRLIRDIRESADKSVADTNDALARSQALIDRSKRRQAQSATWASDGLGEEHEKGAPEGDETG